MLVVFSPSFVADTKMIFRYDFVAPLMKNLKNDHTLNNRLLIILKTMFIIYVIDLSTKNKI